MGAVKRAVDDDPRPGRFVLTGSVRADVEEQMWPGTGRLIRVQMFGMTEQEIRNTSPMVPAPKLLDALVAGDVNALSLPVPSHDLRDYIEQAIRGGFPSLVLDHTPDTRDVWVDSYLEQLLTRDGHLRIADREQYKLARYFEAVAANSAGIVEHKTIYDAAAVDRRTADTYDVLLERLFITEQIPAWTSSRLDRLIKMPKRYVVDGALMAAALGAAVDTILGNGELLGRTIDTFVMARLRPEIS